MQGSRDTRPPERPDINLQWISVVRGGTTDPKHRKQVRSHVTRVQHRLAREQTRTASRRDRRATSNELEGTAKEQLNDPVSFPSTPTPKSAGLEHAPDSGRRKDSISSAPSSYQSMRSTESSPLISTPAWARAFSRGEMSYRTFALQDADNAIGSSLNALQLDLSSVMSFYKSLCQCQSSDFKNQYGLTVKGQSREPRFYEFVHTDSTLLSMAILLGVRNQLHNFGRPIEGRDQSLLLNLERFVINSINIALDDPIRGVSDQLLAVVALCAAYEVKHGDPARYHIHMEGLIRMIGLRGGFAEIGRFDPYLVRFLIWIDVNNAEIIGTKGYLQGMAESNQIRRPEANTAVYRARTETDFRGVVEEV